MATRQDKSQLKMNLVDKSSPLAAKLQGGEFHIQLEADLPISQEPFDSGLETARSLMRTIEQDELATSLVLTDRTRSDECHDPIEVAEALQETAEIPLVLTTSGKANNQENFRDLIARAESAGISGMLCVTGNKCVDHPDSDYPGKRHKRGRPSYLDSVEMLARIKNTAPRFLVGAAVNPFKYTAADEYLQYYKALRKLNSGADYLVTHIGWDMRKLQSLQWYLQMREIDVPVQIP